MNSDIIKSIYIAYQNGWGGRNVIYADSFSVSLYIIANSSWTGTVEINRTSKTFSYTLNRPLPQRIYELGNSKPIWWMG